MTKLAHGTIRNSLPMETSRGRLRMVIDVDDNQWILLSDMKTVFGREFDVWYEIEKVDVLEKFFPMVREGRSADYLFISAASILRCPP